MTNRTADPYRDGRRVRPTNIDLNFDGRDATSESVWIGIAHPAEA